MLKINKQSDNINKIKRTDNISLLKRLNVCYKRRAKKNTKSILKKYTNQNISANKLTDISTDINNTKKSVLKDCQNSSALKKQTTWISRRREWKSEFKVVNGTRKKNNNN